jgi:hypothetical protein
MPASAGTWRSRASTPAGQQRTHLAVTVAGRLLVGAAAIWALLSALGLILTMCSTPVRRTAPTWVLTSGSLTAGRLAGIR